MAENIWKIQSSINGDSVIKFTSQKALKNANFMDSNKLNSFLLDTEDGRQSHQKHLGLIQLFETTNGVTVPMLKDLWSKSAVLEVEAGQTITYDLAVNRQDMKTVTAEDTSDYQDYPGISGSVFKIILNEEFTKGDILTYDMMYGQQVIVSLDHDVEPSGENFLHWVVLHGNDKSKWFDKSKLKANIQYFKIGHVLPEFGTAYSGINMIKNPVGTLTNEFVLGSPRGVETFYTREAARVKSPGLNAFSDAMSDRVQQQLDMMGGDNMFVMGRLKDKRIQPNGAMVGTLLEYFALMELVQMEAWSLLFARAGVYQSANGVARVNEGVWHQMRRGKIIKYSKPGGITMDHLREAAAYVFKNSTNVAVNQRRLTFKAGLGAYNNIMQIFREEAVGQLQALPAGMLGYDQQINGPVFKGPLDKLELQQVIIQTVPIDGIGYVTVEHDPALDYNPFADRFSQGAFGVDMMSDTSYSMVICDATDSTVSNNVNSRVKNAQLVQGGAQRSNLYYVKPADEPLVTYGFEQGRMANGNQYTNVQSSLKQMGRSFWAFSQSAALMLDTTRCIIIELDRKTTR